MNRVNSSRGPSSPLGIFDGWCLNVDRAVVVKLPYKKIPLGSGLLNQRAYFIFGKFGYVRIKRLAMACGNSL